ncbi:hypothetical protein E3Q06_03971 [Wallemia mellicola]|nr:hypothetical protein E3Q21_03973 [Wallemia mellicola]TIB83881.1 hypothetical protein E3Q20_03926 [Wallemia mellicola]TIC38250.1 hypothetical protein E3Q07_03983 [Wallemia mellicola]TIC45308.1 hypothetical protein E3Q06_03971 [Wallemia mellicola]
MSIKNISGKRVLCLADVRGDFESLNRLADEQSADLIIHTGDIGFLEKSSLERATEKVIKHLITYSPIINQETRQHLLNQQNVSSLRSALIDSDKNLLSTFPQLVDQTIKLKVPVYAVAGACEDVAILEKIRMKEYKIDNLYVLDEASSYLLHIGNIKLRLFGIGGAFVLHKLFDNGDGQATIAGGQGTTWITALQVGELIDTAKKVYDPSETRMLITHSPPGREGLLAQLALVLKADLTLSASLHFRMSSSYNDFSVVPNYEVFMQKLVNGRAAVHNIYNSVKEQLEQVLDNKQRILLDNFLLVTDRVPAPNTGKSLSHEEAWKHTWHFNLSDVSVGSVVLNVKDGKIGSEIKSEGFTYSHRNALAENKSPSSASNELANDNGSTQSIAVQPQVESNNANADNTTNPPLSPTLNQQYNTNNPRKKNPNTLFIRGLPIPCSEDEIKDYFSNFKESITTIKILTDHKTGNQRGLSYVEFNNQNDMLSAEKMTGGNIKESTLSIQVSDNSAGKNPNGRKGIGYKNKNKA